LTRSERAARRLAALFFCAALGLAGGCAGEEPAGDPGATPATPRLLLVGIDGATFDRILPLVKAGRLPRLGALIERGAWGPLETLEPTVSPAIWTTIATGRPPAVHGILGFEGVPGATMTTLPTSQMRKVRAFWNILSERGQSVGVAGWWATWPAEPVRGWIVSDRATYTRMEASIGADTPRAHEVFPAELAPTVSSLVRLPVEIASGELRALVDISDEEAAEVARGGRYRHGELLAELKYVHQSDRSTADIALRLMAERPTDVTAVAFYGIDTVSHLAWHFMEPQAFPDARIAADDIRRFGPLIDRYYEFVDGMLGELLDAAGEGLNVIAFSDHGFGPTGQLPWSGGHGTITPGAPLAPDGILILAGPAFRAGAHLDRPHVLDLAPTVLYLRGLPLAADMEGGVHLDVFREEFREDVPLREIATYETGPRERPAGAPDARPELDAATIERLRALGYLE
jgi:hypothetical protein